METEEIRSLARKYWAATGLKSPKNETLFVETCVACQLDPYKREVYAIDSSYTDLNGRFHDGFHIITGYEVYLKRAERTGKLDGWACQCETAGKNELVAKLTIYRKDWKMPFIHEVYWSEAVQVAKSGANKGQPNPMWAKMGRFMLKKVAIAQGFRLCFPDELGGMPYTADELPSPSSSNEKQGEESVILPMASAAEPPRDKEKEERETADGNAPTAATATKESPFKAQLEGYMKEFATELKGHPSKLIRECIESGEGMEAMVTRIQQYLMKKGIRI